MKNHSANSARRIIFFGRQDLQNSVLIGFIQQRTNINCTLACTPHWNPEWNDFEGDTLIFVDAENGCPEKAQILLEIIFDKASNSKVVFFNVECSSSIERLISWPIVNGIFYKDSSQQQLVDGITCIFNGELWLSRRLITEYLLRTRCKPRKSTKCQPPLTRREKEILSLTATGATNTQIAEQLNVSMHTVKTHIYNLFKKLDVSNRIQAVNWAKENLEGLQESIA